MSSTTSVGAAYPPGAGKMYKRQVHVQDTFHTKKVSANSQVMTTILQCVQALCALETRVLPLSYWDRSLEDKVARRALPGSERHFLLERTSLPAGRREV